MSGIITPEATLIVTHVAPSFVSEQTREKDNPNGAAMSHPLSNTRSIKAGASAPHVATATTGSRRASSHLYTPEHDGVIEHLILSLKEERVWQPSFVSFEHARPELSTAVGEFIIY